MPLQIPHPKTPLHLYRHLLRESTYLPALCRPWVAWRIQQRFRDCRDKQPATTSINKAHTSLRYLRSANAGNIHRIERLCFMATGRVGKRRRILTSSQLARAPPTDTTALEQSRVQNVVTSSPSNGAPGVTSASATPTSHDWLENWSIDMIEALARSQVSQQARDWPQNMRRALDTRHITTGTNCFGQPYGRKLVRNKLKKHWASVLKQILPPLPRGEWDHLAALVQAQPSTDELKIPSRRPVARPVQGHSLASMSEPWDWTQHVLKPARVIERGSSRKQKSLTGKEDQDPRGHGNPIGVRVISPRVLQRLYARIWNMSPLMEKKPGMQKWSVSWGKEEDRISAPSPRDLFFFEGVANDGSLLNGGKQSSTSKQHREVKGG
ncbi:hypothetical protein F5B22DRAFT_619004 [Xylaria bambusicola]|uniref:uncharacterized protein n=1 Tax=Xylaria bambusicola TaxID=326684 RepID=UPI0020089B9D|nr:uncharacterized protein F5B22DRAFT_619004 [Xylaria bambusicola]KAI0508862.1 hypothetical protein F5B22DRAFT_619004 [Xylaria bambusicola]